MLVRISGQAKVEIYVLYDATDTLDTISLRGGGEELWCLTIFQLN